MRSIWRARQRFDGTCGRAEVARPHSSEFAATSVRWRFAGDTSSHTRVRGDFFRTVKITTNSGEPHSRYKPSKAYAVVAQDLQDLRRTGFPQPTLTPRVHSADSGSVKIVQRHSLPSYRRTPGVGIPQLSAGDSCQQFHMTVIVQNRLQACIADLRSTPKLVLCIH